MGAGWNRDTAVGVVGAMVLVAAMAGVFFYERSQFDTYQVDWSQQAAGGETQTGDLDEGNSQSHSLTVDAERLSTVSVALSWSDDVGEPDTLELVVQGPNGTYADSIEDSSSPLELAFDVHEQPDVSTATGRSLEDAREQVNASTSWTNGTGEWTATVTLVDAPGQQAAGQQMSADGSQEYEVALTYEQWAPSLTPT